jgi:hypothetical protein|tara:strand:+ start:14332 stop:14553 length:222 start_codon:yes stop_codon:yes gene_type:complete
MNTEKTWMIPKTDHYTSMKIEPVDFIIANDLDFCEGNVIKYVSRHKNKNGAEDIRKAIDYLTIILKTTYNDKE